MKKPQPKRPRSSKHRLIRELENNSDGLKKLLKKIIKNGGILKTNAEISIKGIDDLIREIRKSNIDEIDDIIKYALDD